MVKVIPLGGLGEIGLNMMLFEAGETILVVDCGLMFPDEHMPGVDLVIPSFAYLEDKRERVKAVILTHGHEDHIGAMPFFLRDFEVPVYGTRFTLALLEEKLKEHHLPGKVDFREVRAGDLTEVPPFKVEYISVSHSIVDGVGLAIQTPEGLIIHSGDFRIDPTPVDSQFTDLVRFAHHGESGVLAFFSDSTNAEKEGSTLSEREVTRTIEEIFRQAKGRIIVAAFASNITRIQQVILLAMKYGRRIVFNGKSMTTNVMIARRLGFIDMPDDLEISERQIPQFADDKITVLTTGTQGEPMSALARMAQGAHRTIQIKPGDTVVLSSRFIPGNERAITNIINRLYRLGADVIYEKVSEIHTSGHARQEELKTMLSLVRPRYLVPVHGEYRHLIKHARLAVEMGMSPEQTLVVEDGAVLACEGGRVMVQGQVETGRIMVDGKGVGDVAEMVLRDRRRLSGHGMVIVLLAIDAQTGEPVYGPDILSRGFVLQDQGGYILQEARELVREVTEELAASAPPVNWSDVEEEIERRLRRFFYKSIERNPLVLPLIISV
ncbi:Ribonuclease J 1 [uncultured Desulfatiglans sp.]|nr:Ribonuclease J 1 [uncultured Desulfatiglans sp.]